MTKERKIKKKLHEKDDKAKKDIKKKALTVVTLTLRSF
jgi:hypothetical protein